VKLLVSGVNLHVNQAIFQPQINDFDGDHRQGLWAWRLARKWWEGVEGEGGLAGCRGGLEQALGSTKGVFGGSVEGTSMLQRIAQSLPGQTEAVGGRGFVVKIPYILLFWFGKGMLPGLTFQSTWNPAAL
jgi:hypothetical protein